MNKNMSIKYSIGIEFGGGSMNALLENVSKGIEFAPLTLITLAAVRITESQNSLIIT